jgi:hypothetical protein
MDDPNIFPVEKYLFKTEAAAEVVLASSRAVVVAEEKSEAAVTASSKAEEEEETVFSAAETNSMIRHNTQLIRSHSNQPDTPSQFPSRIKNPVNSYMSSSALNRNTLTENDNFDKRGNNLFTPLRIEDAQSNGSNPVISAPEKGRLNKKLSNIPSAGNTITMRPIKRKLEEQNDPKQEEQNDPKQEAHINRAKKLEPGDDNSDEHRAKKLKLREAYEIVAEAVVGAEGGEPQDIGEIYEDEFTEGGGGGKRRPRRQRQKTKRNNKQTKQTKRRKQKTNNGVNKRQTKRAKKRQTKKV